jgi:hypothetical protein
MLNLVEMTKGKEIKVFGWWMEAKNIVKLLKKIKSPSFH